MLRGPLVLSRVFSVFIMKLGGRIRQAVYSLVNLKYTWPWDKLGFFKNLLKKKGGGGGGVVFLLILVKVYRNMQKICVHQNSFICNEQYFLALITDQSLNRFSQKLIGSWFLFDFGVRFINKNKIRFILLRYNFYNLWVHELNTKTIYIF